MVKFTIHLINSTGCEIGYKTHDLPYNYSDKTVTKLVAEYIADVGCWYDGDTIKLTFDVH